MIESLDHFDCLVEEGGEKSQEQIRNDRVPESILFEIIQKRADLCRVVTLNRNLPESIIRLLAEFEDPNVRADVAMRRSVPIDVREKLARDVDDSVRARVAWNEKTAKLLLELLANDELSIVAEPAQQRLHELNATLKVDPVNVQKSIGAFPA